MPDAGSISVDYNKTRSVSKTKCKQNPQYTIVDANLSGNICISRNFAPLVCNALIILNVRKTVTNYPWPLETPFIVNVQPLNLNNPNISRKYSRISAMLVIFQFCYFY